MDNGVAIVWYRNFIVAFSLYPKRVMAIILDIKICVICVIG